MSKQLATIDNSAANRENVDEQMEQNNVEKAARGNSSAAAPVLKSTAELETADNAVASSEQVAEQAEESRLDKVAFEDGVSPAAAQEYIERGRGHD